LHKKQLNPTKYDTNSIFIALRWCRRKRTRRTPEKWQEIRKVKTIKWKQKRKKEAHY
jgi:hypothetical protein